MFASDSMRVHLARGALGFGALAVTIAFAESQPWMSIAGIVVALVALRGCPTCWTVGLVETLIAWLNGRQAKATCVDGSCARAARLP